MYNNNIGIEYNIDIFGTNKKTLWCTKHNTYHIDKNIQFFY